MACDLRYLLGSCQDSSAHHPHGGHGAHLHSAGAALFCCDMRIQVPATRKREHPNTVFAETTVEVEAMGKREWLCRGVAAGSCR